MGGYRSNRGRGYGGGGGGSFSMAFPPFTWAIKRLVIVNAAIYLLNLLAVALMQRSLYGALSLWLRPVDVAHGEIWQLVTYSFFHLGLFHLLFNMLQLWMFGATLESEWGSRQFLRLYFVGAVGGALTTVFLAYLGTFTFLDFLGISPYTPTLGASGAVFAVMVAFAIVHGDQTFMMFPFPFSIRAKYLVGILIFINLAGTFEGFGSGRGQSIAYIAHLGGALFGWLYVKMAPRGGYKPTAVSERYFGIRNAYYRWKRRRAARRFEVYMRQHDRSKYFDEYGNYRDPEDGDGGKGNGEHRGPWVQ